MDQKFWDERYLETEQIWSNNPNPVLLEHASTLTPGRALDLGCGEGADARWLAGRGWQVTAVDISPVAIDRARALGDEPAITWQQADVVVAAPTPRAFDLVSLQYFTILKTPGDEGVRGIIDAVAVGGTLLSVFHEIPDNPPEHWHDLNPHDFYQPHDIGTLLGDDWRIDIDQTQSRTTAPPEGSHHTHDTVLLAVRLS
ncbi:thiopurine S-methyltransferase [Williamsia limnetica]|uniref:Thiopurine S-methyltransferase n=1 Tax=Williamsia limnetica TaxID=882452 RepID=A0A318S0F4_WILLI|nr:class I SAM-dependent methyltransferase [Williamsia limnetica]PYE16464.1 thiopurine S-methyltransferase [Williamsia limnetica]